MDAEGFTGVSYGSDKSDGLNAISDGINFDANQKTVLHLCNDIKKVM